MNRPKLKGPDLKKPELKAPAFLSDLYYDLRDRRLLPLIALVVVAIAAVPFLLGGDGVESYPAIPDPATALEAETAKSSKLVVVEATPGLRDYRKRLRGRSATDPFKQRYTEPAGGSASSSSAGSAASESSPSSAFSEEAVTAEGTVEVESGGGSSGGSGGGGSSNGGGAGSGGSGGEPELVLFDYAIDVRISRSDDSGDDDGSQAQQEEPVVKHRVLPQSPLPGDKAPVVTYMGPGRKGGNEATGKVLLLVSNDVTSISGERHCVSGAGDSCQLLEVEPGFPLTFAYGDGGVYYTIKVLKIELVVTGSTRGSTAG